MKMNLICYSHFAADPYFNMAFDEWMLGQALEHPDRVAIRLYTWKVGAITFGFNQRPESALKLEQLGDTPAIRRATGGRALYHDPGELTYSVALKDSGAVSSMTHGSVAASSAMIADVLVDFLDRIGIQSNYVKQSSRENARPEFFHKAPCFASHARHEVVTGQGKIVASAQRRVEQAILQHGAIKINGVADHPALAFPGDNQLPANKLVLMNEKSFTHYRQVFGASFADHFGSLCQDSTVAGADLNAIRTHAAYIKENPFSRRDIFKHKPTKSSLLGA